MAMGTRKQRQRQEELWYRRDLAEAPGHPFHRRLNEVLDQASFDEFCEARCRKFYHEKLGRPSLAPGMYFRVMLIGFFEGIESERGIAWRVADSLCLRQFLQIGLDERTPDHVTIPHDSEAEITRLKNGRTALAYKAEHAVDMDTGAIVAVTTHGGAVGDTTSVGETLPAAGEAVAEQIAEPTADGKFKVNAKGVEELVADKGYHSGDVLASALESGVRSYIAEPDRGQRKWAGKRAEQVAVYANRQRIGGHRGKQLLRRRGELVERTFAHAYETGSLRRLYVRGNRSGCCYKRRHAIWRCCSES
jgi:transposase